MNRPVVEFPLFYGDEREDVREFLGNYRRAGLLNGWDEEKLALGLPLFLKKHASVWFKTLTEADENESFQVLSQKLISHFESKVTLWQLRQKLEERRQLLGETVADYYYDILSFCSRLNLPKSEWLYCFVRGLRPEIREHVILQQPPDFESALNIAKLKELVTLSRKSNNGQEVENFEELQSNPSEKEVKQSVGKKSMFVVQISKIMEIVVLIVKFDRANLIVFVMGTAFSVKILNWAVIEVRNPTLEACIGETI